ncbi:DUF4286 family protein [Parapusillimonas granuli]|uniref:DUF4286 family protein n=1 Tax=Parapusillimonas granuli TaxID=380911 RepID=UPI00183CD1E7|nr:DUF4286 family protein [Parapusillimonas granuli]MBB5215420.1 hypothetical protein [Parapusillimonas granuli]MEB2400258.1 hypothetical protein [Alcaligenaceae bacterium]
MNVLLMKFPGLAVDRDRIAGMLRLGVPELDACALDVMHAVDGVETYAYLEPLAAAGGPSLDTLRRIVAGQLGALFPRASLLALRATLDLPGASADQPAPWHYVVETDVLPAAEDDFNQWYDTEHLPGLAAVPGTVRARRYLAADASPRYHAAYDLASRETFGSEPWLAVRATDWSSRVRPNFTNTRRIMFKRADVQGN